MSRAPFSPYSTHAQWVAQVELEAARKRALAQLSSLTREREGKERTAKAWGLVMMFTVALALVVIVLTGCGGSDEEEGWETTQPLLCESCKT